jgi:hypothetical protein
VLIVLSLSSLEHIKISCISINAKKATRVKTIYIVLDTLLITNYAVVYGQQARRELMPHSGNRYINHCAVPSKRR